MSEARVIDFYKKKGLYNKKLFNNFKKCSLLIDNRGSFSYEFFGVYVQDDGRIKMILPKIKNIYDELIWVHEYAHAIFVNYFSDSDEIFPNIMESEFINMYVQDKEEIIKSVIESINSSDSIEHTLGMKIKLSNIK